MKIPIKIFDEGDSDSLALKKGQYKIYIQPRAKIFKNLNIWLNEQIVKIKTPLKLNVSGKSVILEKLYADEENIIAEINVEINPVPIVALLAAISAAGLALALVIWRVEKVIDVPGIYIIGCGILVYYVMVKK